MTEATRLWLLSRIDQRCREAVDGLLHAISEHVGIATADAVTIRMLSMDGTLLLPVTAYHPVSWRAEAMAAVMSQTAQPADSGLWQPVIQLGQVKRYRIDITAAPPEASAAQQQFLRDHPIRAVLAAPVMSGERVIGGVAVVRFGVTQPFTDEDEALVIEVTRRIAPALELQRIAHVDLESQEP